jgi:ABC-type antimicrobial peptide transport system permease subunit
VGVVKTVKLEDLAGDQPTLGVFYYAHAQGRIRPAFTARAMKFAIKTPSSAEVVARELRARLASLDRNLPLYDIRTMHDREDASLRGRKSALTLAIAVGAIALCLSTIGIYGVLAYLVSQRKRELGIRLALGCTRQDIFELVLREGMVLTAIGLASGLSAYALVAQGIGRWLFDVRPLDPTILAGIVLGMGATALLACSVPARRAMRISPATILAES